MTQTTFKKLIDAGVLQIGDGYRAKLEELGGNGLIFLRAGQISDTEISFEGVERFQSDLTSKLASKVSMPGDTIITTKGNSTGRTAHVAEGIPQFVYSPHLSFWRSLDAKRLARGFLRHWSNSSEFRTQLNGMMESTDMAPYLSLSDQQRLKITLPSIEEQEAVSRILGVLDDKIELNRKMNRTQEETAQALFKSWFLDFDPVQAKSDGRAPVGMNTNTAALFPAHFEDSELGPIPLGWRVSTVGEKFKLTMGQSPDGTTYNGDQIGTPFYQGRTDFGFRFPVRRIFTTAPSRMAATGDTLVCVRAPVGDVNMAAEACCIGRGLAAVRHLSGSRSYTYYAMHALNDDFVVFEGDGTLFGSINGGAFRALKLVAPPVELVAAFEAVCIHLDGSIESNEQQNCTLTALRNSLLPKFLSGEIRIRDAENQAGAAL